MKAATIVLSVIASAVAQSVTILSPAPRTTLSPGSTFVVDVDELPDPILPSYDVSIAIGLESCGANRTQNECVQLASEDMLGTVLYAGDFTPQPRPNSTHLFQNYTVQVPSTMERGQALLNVAHFYLGGDGASPSLETISLFVTIY
ncbi:hypothetical protein BV20DRAFT_963334 [Pilatotrama ljubarskyi]|nr:hypothetical protein BV20DRAFT_963334 [Pilatotrama ljubarskyi]